MNLKSTAVIFVGLGLAGVLAFAIASAGAQSAPAQPAMGAAKPKITEEAFKNIQVLKGIPSDQLIPTMQFVATSLGVECDYCHVQGAFDKDDKQPKQTARKMMQMMFAINKDSFNGRLEVTCYSCHRGAPRPVGTPVISDGAQTHGEVAPTAATGPQPTAAQVIDKYIQALGGAEAIRKVTSRVEVGTATVGDRKVPIKIYVKAPAQRMSVMQMPGGDSYTVFDGHSGWLGVPGRPVRDMSGSDLDAARIDADLYFPLHIQQIFTDLRVTGIEKIGEHSTYAVSGVREGQSPVKLYFDQQSGLLVRMMHYTDTPLGRNPTQTDYADYKEIQGVKTAYRWTIARPSGQFTIQVDDLQRNVRVEDKMFAKPAPPPPPATKPSAP